MHTTEWNYYSIGEASQASQDYEWIFLDFLETKGWSFQSDCSWKHQTKAINFTINLRESREE